MKMKKIMGLLVLLSLMGFAVSVFAQADLDVFPIGTTKMVYEVITEEMDEPQTLEDEDGVQGNHRGDGRAPNS